ncbi:hypothetical protein [Corynebacterium auris]|uniref:hypothetical protein n=1 Tax=Corynebacterium auris TaxID=44750 RepID=UPI0025B4DD62|nr:hypothetical protein [Corynebacterium auris]WJY67056.1 hypothetical protein CAURIS_00540 [Corynebacterium auris]
MKGIRLSVFVLVLVVSCLVIAYSESPGHPGALIGFAGLVVAGVLAVLHFLPKRDTEVAPRLTASEVDALRNVADREGEASAMRQLRENHPHVSVVPARAAVRGFVR